jgi:adenylate cyclase class IV
MIATVKKLREIYGDVKVIVDLDLSIKKIVLKI